MMYLHTIGDSTRYNGWTNWQTFTVGTLILNDEGLYNSACRYERGTAFPSWHSFIDCRGLEDFVTADGVAFADPKLDTDELDELIQEINA